MIKSGSIFEISSVWASLQSTPCMRPEDRQVKTCWYTQYTKGAHLWLKYDVTSSFLVGEVWLWLSIWCFARWNTCNHVRRSVHFHCGDSNLVLVFSYWLPCCSCLWYRFTMCNCKIKPHLYFIPMFIRSSRFVIGPFLVLFCSGNWFWMKGTSLRDMVVLKCVSSWRPYRGWCLSYGLVWVYVSSDRITVNMEEILLFSNLYWGMVTYVSYYKDVLHLCSSYIGRGGLRKQIR